ncbi:MAG TPA: type II toxin-antitoxin system VapC family toxin [Actinobacteria bacterium]|nr:type II toxin-antitoxin system VapC family toxin [Actinomycetes bacterium]HEX21535.1 type II toxin-antitoxin system VapC family toxin [Actinomycetota bacterium]
MKYLIDTCVLSELKKAKPDKKVISWITQNDEENYYLSSLTFGELHKGICKLPKSKRKDILHYWVEHDLSDRFRNRIIDINLKVAKIWGEIQGKSELLGRPMPAIDSLIAATGLAYDLIVVTRNTVDMQSSGASLINPWE